MDKVKISILVIDDDEGVRLMMTDVLEIQGYEVHTAVDGKAGMEKLGTMKQLPSVILLDLMMPEVSGWEFLDFQHNNRSYASIPVIICSAYEGSASSIGSVNVLIKPVQLESLIGAVKALAGPA